ncbi:MAG: 23S rRNA (pseudouridine(1915)-N(3))-methyltransferase RlmH [Alphaproteobacteria bacterium]|nr:MAG: 23S rRNA (pseudouridine(1915)-N(3))-methyltransferase RlmH [Alphaproteobacteria bacterium]
MRLRLIAVGRLRAGPERELVDDWLARAGRGGRALGFGPIEEIEIDERRHRTPAAQAEAIRAALPAGAALCVLDERGRTLSSPEFAARLAGWRDAGRPAAALVIGGADGLTPELRAQADLVLSFGPMVWPHMLARAMLAEQLYRAVTILAGTPYHRG